MKALDTKNRSSIALDSVNYRKNRYLDVVPFDDNRVILKQHINYRPSPTGYINASFVMTSESVSQFIATQGPLPHTSEDFREMIIQYHCPAIIMLTALVDNNNTVKCGDYVQAEDGPREFGNTCIATKWTQTTDTSLVLRCTEVKNKEKSHHFPFCTFSILNGRIIEFQKTLPLFVKSSKEYLLSHPVSDQLLSTAGIGRTGTYCVIHNTIRRVLIGDMTALDLVNTVTTLRSQRIGMVQTLHQFVLCYEAILDELENLVSNTNANGD